MRSDLPEGRTGEVEIHTVTAFIVECDEDVSETADRLAGLIDDWQEGRITLAEYTAHIAKAIQAERDEQASHATKLQAIRERVEQFEGGGLFRYDLCRILDDQ